MARLRNLFRAVGLAARMTAPWLLHAAWFMVGVIAVSVISFWRGIPKVSQRIADAWLDRAVEAGFPTRWDRTLYYVFRCLALVMIVAGWIAIACLTMLIIKLIL